ncbi:uncharacterized protein LOC129946504 [Eupeodes corollae]|uniref:uncharacterized protein LOC129946504 n=1 Tax=Eupeodes corollae TaxID=290404 RepID=UPI00249358DB|nr:uncharacterized protein LOC129946504 [Eupeodes corollae]
MNSIILITMLLAVLCASVNARIYGGVFRHPEHPGKCHFGKDVVLESGQISRKHNGECAIVTCFDNGHASIMKCVPQKMREGCHEGKVLQPDAPYPECCTREISCKDHYYSR